MRTIQKLPDDLKELLALVRAGKLFAVQQWISEGSNYGAAETHRLNPVYEAMEMRFHSMVEVFLLAGLDQQIKNDLLDMAVDSKRMDLVLLCHEYGANLNSVEFECVCDTCNPQLIRYFLDNGADADTGRPFAKGLRRACRLFIGIYMSYKDKIPGLKPQLDSALRYHVEERAVEQSQSVSCLSGYSKCRIDVFRVEPNIKNANRALVGTAAPSGGRSS